MNWIRLTTPGKYIYGLIIINSVYCLVWEIHLRKTFKKYRWGKKSTNKYACGGLVVIINVGQ